MSEHQAGASLETDLIVLLNRHSAENMSGTPDFVLAKFLSETLKAYNEAVSRRAEWRGESVELPALIPVANDSKPIRGAHSRACGILKHEHGVDCSMNCPTCHGDAI